MSKNAGPSLTSSAAMLDAGMRSTNFAPPDTTAAGPDERSLLLPKTNVRSSFCLRPR